MKTQLSAFLLVIVINAPWAGFAADDTKHDQNAKVPSTDKPQAAQPASEDVMKLLSSASLLALLLIPAFLTAEEPKPSYPPPAEVRQSVGR